MENFSYNSYPESGDSSPRSREIDFENPPPWEDSNYKVKFMCSYGGKIHPRPHDNQLAYVGGETKILAVDRSIKFAHLAGKLSAICDNSEVCFKYQLPGEDLDALISVTNDDDLEHMMHEYDRLYRASSKPARLRLFLFTVSSQTGSFGSGDAKSDRDRFVDALNTGPVQAPVVPPPNNVDFLFGLEKGAVPPSAVVAAAMARARDPGYSEADVVIQNHEDRIVSDRHDPIQKHIQDLQRLRISEEQQPQAAAFRRKSDEYYVQKMPEKLAPSQTLPAHLPAQSVPIPATYWPEKQMPYPPSSIGPDHQQQQQQQQQVYMIPSQPNMYQMARPVTGPAGQPNQGYYMQRMTPEVYREQPVYNVVSQAPQPTLPPQVVPKTTPFQATTTVMDSGYTQVAYDSASGRQVYYTTPPGVVSQPQGPVPLQYQPAPGYAVAGNYNQEGGSKVVPVKVSQTSG
ncbi:hypothetical protein DCAR_0933714 [Daucus carota subsp. sativus]|uniref:PB1 domain-containing protein n=1 Tax=Daucus carota subsp. sativus TaxID=79200 RepID=A0A175YER8_DAUCS|nr:PREDICTED: uncharacterized protein LOC108203171 [Daucus carota subsp. sativus]WOH14197.1 hypothetical protein DCAR_0933714 [Daucus carota subsp. sativus]